MSPSASAAATPSGLGGECHASSASPQDASLLSSGGLEVGGVVIDVPDVLYDATHWRRWLLQLVNRLGVGVGYAEFYRAWDAQLLDVHRGRREFAEVLQTFLVGFGLSWAQVDEIEAASRIQRQNLEQNVRPLAGAIRALEGLTRLNLPMVAWADAPATSARLAERLERLLPQTQFHAALTSFDLECTQPAADCYLAAIDALQLPPHQVVYIGHDTQHLAGAKSAGLWTVAVNHDCTARADVCLTRLEDLVDLAATWRPVARPSRIDNGRSVLSQRPTMAAAFGSQP